MANNGCFLAVFVVISMLFMPGCDPVSRHKFTTALLDGYPSMPPADEYFAYYSDQLASIQAADADKAEAETPEKKENQGPSVHLPYDEKTCNACHDKGNTNTHGLIVSKDELCGVCHIDFIQGSVVHGPVAINACLVCHEPHSSQNAVLLKTSGDKLCQSCHTEQRLAERVHKLVRTRGMACAECHDPHFSNSRYLL